MKNLLYLFVFLFALLSCNWDLPQDKQLAGKTCQRPTAIVKVVPDKTNLLKITLSLNAPTTDVAGVVWRVVDHATSTEVLNMPNSQAGNATVAVTLPKGGSYDLFADVTTNCNEKFTLTDTYSATICKKLTSTDITKTADANTPLKVVLTLPTSQTDISTVLWRVVDANSKEVARSQTLTAANNSFTVNLPVGGTYTIFADIVTTCTDTYTIQSTYATRACSKLTTFTITPDPTNSLKFTLQLPTTTDVASVVWHIFSGAAEIKHSDTLAAANNAYVATLGNGSYSIYAEIKSICGDKYSTTPTNKTIAVSIVYFVSFDNLLYAIDGDTGNKLWTANIGKLNFGSPTVTQDGVVYVGSEKVRAFDAYTGNALWAFTPDDPTDGFVCTPIVSGGKLYIGSAFGSFYVLNTKDGTKVWGKKIAAQGIQASPSLYKGVIYVGSADTKFWAIPDQVDPTPTALLTTGGEIKEKCFILDGIAFFGSKDQKLYAYDVTNKRLKWSATTGGAIISGPTVQLSTAWVGSNALYGYNKDTGTPVSTFTPVTKGGFESSSTIYQAKDLVNRLYVGSDNGNFYSINISNGVQIVRATGGEIHASPLVVNDIVYVGSYDGKLWAYDAATLVAKWTFTSQDKIFSSACMLSKDGNVYHSGILGYK